MDVWQFQEAKAKLTEFVNKAKKEPQVISRYGKSEIVAMDIELYKKLTMPTRDIVTFFMQSPLYGLDLSLERDISPSRDVEL